MTSPHKFVVHPGANLCQAPSHALRGSRTEIPRYVPRVGPSYRSLHVLESPRHSADRARAPRGFVIAAPSALASPRPTRSAFAPSSSTSPMDSKSEATISRPRAIASPLKSLSGEVNLELLEKHRGLERIATKESRSQATGLRKGLEISVTLPRVPLCDEACRQLDPGRCYCLVRAPRDDHRGRVPEDTCWIEFNCPACDRFTSI